MEKYAKLIEAIDNFERLASEEVVHGPYKKENGREIVIVIKDGIRRTMTYARYLMEKALGRTLDPDKETVHHLNGDVNDNRLDNLELIDRKKHSSNDTRRVKLIKFKCDMCGNKFERSPRLVRDKSKKGAIGIFCSRSCAGKHNRMRQLGKVKKFPKKQPYIESKYYKKRPVAYIEYLLEKFAQYDPWEPNVGLADNPKDNYPIVVNKLTFKQIQSIQNKLNDENNEVKEDGIWGPITMRNLQNYERMNGLWISKPYTINRFTLNHLGV